MVARLNIWLRYLFDAQRLKVPRKLRPLYREIFSRSLRKIGTSPDIFKGEDFNNKIKWLMLFDQGEDIIQCSDKLAVRDYVSERVGKEYLNEIYNIWDNPELIDFETLPDAFVLKTNHDSGSVWIVKNKYETDLDGLREKVSQSLRRTYGVGKGEWCYTHIPPRIFAEELLPSGPSGIADYKFHCAKGEVIFVQYIYDRCTNKPKEQIIMPDGKITELKINYENSSGNAFIRPTEWDKMLHISKTVSQNFKYVRVDLYLTPKGISFGEMTFFPHSGNCRHWTDQKFLGSLIELDRTSPRFLQ